MAKYSEINHLINTAFNTNNNIRYIPAINPIDYIFYNCQRLILTDDSAIPFAGIISNHLEDYNKLHIKCKKLLLIHNPPDARRKKEDIYILKQKMAAGGIDCLYFDEYTRDTWQDNEARIIPYGIPTQKILDSIDTDNCYVKPKKILIVNFHKDDNIKKLYDQIKLNNIECDYLDTLPATIQKFAKYIQQYQLVINLANINVHFSLMSILCGALVVCPQISPTLSINSILQVSSFNQIYQVINNFTYNKEQLLLDKKNILDSYNETQYQSTLEVL